MNKIFSFSVSLLGTSSIALASIPFGIGSAAAQEAKAGDAADLGVMSISLKDAIQPNFGFQGAL
ncbi:carbamoyl-phosphate synthase, partial [Synechococcus lacustris L1E-Slac]|nr:carbamoyl-phosphate synthase [Synechococcus lacustris L1E-Slac]